VNLYIVSVRYRRDVPGAVLLTFVDPCERCKRKHLHGAPTDQLDSDGTYGTRVAHCPDGKGDSYVLVPA